MSVPSIKRCPGFLLLLDKYFLVDTPSRCCPLPSLKSVIFQLLDTTLCMTCFMGMKSRERLPKQDSFESMQQSSFPSCVSHQQGLQDISWVTKLKVTAKVIRLPKNQCVLSRTRGFERRRIQIPSQHHVSCLDCQWSWSEYQCQL